MSTCFSAETWLPCFGARKRLSIANFHPCTWNVFAQNYHHLRWIITMTFRGFACSTSSKRRVQESLAEYLNSFNGSFKLINKRQTPELDFSFKQGYEWEGHVQFWWSNRFIDCPPRSDPNNEEIQQGQTVRENRSFEPAIQSGDNAVREVTLSSALLSSSSVDEGQLSAQVGDAKSPFWIWKC